MTLSTRSVTAALAVLLLAGCQPPVRPAAPSPAPVLQAADSALVSRAAAIVAGTPRVTPVWSGFWSASQPFVLTRREGQRMLLVTRGAAPAGFARVGDAELPPELRGVAYARTGFPEDLGPHGMALRYGLGRDSMPVMPIDRRTFPQFLEFFFHEAFHGYQEARFDTVGVIQTEMDQPSVDPAQTADPEFAALAEVERGMLASGLGVTEPDSLAGLLRSYLAVRDRRLAGRPDVPRVENHFERTEGTAQLVGITAMLLATGRPASDVPAVLRERDFSRALSALPPGGPESDTRIMRGRLYGTGAALALYLDRLGVDWRPRMEAGTVSLAALVARAVGYVPARDGALADAALHRFGYAEALREWRELQAAESTADPATEGR